jgi:hypothetical protein
MHDTTVGTSADGATGREAFGVGECDDAESTEASVTTFTADVEGAGELMTSPKAKPMPSAARTMAATPIRTTVLLRTDITPAFRCAEEVDGAAGTDRDPGFPARRWECPNPGPFFVPPPGGFGDLR